MITRSTVTFIALTFVLAACGGSEGDGAAGGDAAAAALTVTPAITAIAAGPPPSTATVAPTPTPAASVAPTPTLPTEGAPTLAQLRSARLTERDLGPDWFQVIADSVEVRYPAVSATFVHMTSDRDLTIALHDARNGVPDFVALRFLNNATVNQLTQVQAAGYGANGVRYRYNYDEDGVRWYGEIAAWRQGQVVVAIQVEDLKPDACVCEAAELQYRKLAATIR